MTTSNNRQHETDTINLIDIVFTAMVTIGLTPEVLQVPHITGMLSEPWVMEALKGKPRAPAGPEFLHLGVFLVGLLTLLLSWFGIHASLEAKPIRYNNVWGMLRFMLDVALVLLYGVILIFFRQLQTVLFLIALVYTLYVVWDLFKTFEYKDKYWNIEVLRENRIKALAYRLWISSCRPKGGHHDFRPAAEQEAQKYRGARAMGSWILGFVVTFQRQFVTLLFAVSFVALWLL